MFHGSADSDGNLALSVNDGKGLLMAKAFTGDELFGERQIAWKEPEVGAITSGCVWSKH